MIQLILKHITYKYSLNKVITKSFHPSAHAIREQMKKREFYCPKKGKESQNEDCNLYARSLTILSDNMERDDFHSCPF